LAACVLFYIGIGKPYVAEHGFDYEPMFTIEPIRKRV
jgi:hypothetical protein